MTHAAIFSGSSPGWTSSLETSAISTAKVTPASWSWWWTRGSYSTIPCQVPVRCRDYVRESMEASEKPQLPLEPSATDAAVRAIGDRLVIERLEVNDVGAARVVQEQVGEGHAPAETVTRAIEIGTRVIESEGTAANVDYVKAELERQLRPLADRLGGVIEEGQEEFAERLAGS